MTDLSTRPPAVDYFLAQGQHSIRINDQWRLCFRWAGEDAHEVEIVDYH